MAKINKRRRSSNAVRRLNLSPLASIAATADLQIGVVTKKDGAHYSIVEQDGTRRLFVEVLLVPAGREVTAQVSGGPMWTIPDEGDEVCVAMPQGNLNGFPIIVGGVDAGTHPRTAPGRVVIWARDRIELIAPEVVLSSDGTSGDRLVTETAYNQHKHPSGTGPTGVPDNVGNAGTTIARGQ